MGSPKRNKKMEKGTGVSELKNPWQIKQSYMARKRLDLRTTQFAVDLLESWYFPNPKISF